MASKRELERSRDAIAAYLDVANAPGTSYASQQGAWAGIRRELKKVGANNVTASDLVQITSKTVSNSNFRAAYLVNAAQRLSADDRGRTTALLSELDNYRKHVRADNQRLFGAQRLRAASNAYGPLLGWYAVMDDRTTAECRAMNGQNFDPYDPPAAGLPGITHVNCRCRPGPPHPEKKTEVPSSANTSSGDTEMSLELSDLNWSPRKNWVEKRGGLPPYVVRIAKHLIAKGFSRSHAIATAINVVKKMARTGDLNWPGRQNANAGSRAKSAGAVARWEAMKNSRVGDPALELSNGGNVNLRRALNKAREHGRSYGTHKNSIGPGVRLNNKVTIAAKKPGSAPGMVKNAAKGNGLPKGGHVKKVMPGDAPSQKDAGKKVSVGKSSVKGQGPSDVSKVTTKRVAQTLAQVPLLQPKHHLRPGINTPTTVGAAPKKVSVGPRAAKGNAQAAPAKVAAKTVFPAHFTPQHKPDLKVQKPGAAPRGVNLAMPGAPFSSGQKRQNALLKRIRKTYKPRKIKVIKSFKPTKVA